MSGLSRNPTPARSTAGIVLGGAHVWREDTDHGLEPRLLLPVANVPLVSYTLAWLKRGGLRDVVICVNEGLPLLRAQLRDGAEVGLRLHYYVDRMPRGPGGCLRDAGELVPAGNYVVVEGSILPTVDLAALLAAHRESNALATLAVYGENGREPTPGHTSSPIGVHIFSEPALPRISSHSYQDIKETLVRQLLRERCAVAVFPATEPSPRISNLTTYLAVQAGALERARRDGELHAGYLWNGDTALHPTARLSASARVVGPAMVGAGTRIDDRVLLIGPVVVGRHCRLRAGVLVANSVIWDHAELESDSRVDGCVVAAGATVPRKSSLRGLAWSRSARRGSLWRPGEKVGRHA